jgi:hypothetical protein
VERWYGLDNNYSHNPDHSCCHYRSIREQWTLKYISITREEFLAIYNKYPPGRFVVFIYKHFSKEGTNKDLVPKVAISRIVVWILAISFIIGFVGTVISDFTGKPMRTFIAIPTYSFAFVLVAVGVCMFTARTINNLRIRKIARKMGLPLYEYNKLADQYFEL